MKTQLQDEIDRRLAVGNRAVTLAEIEHRLRELGYRLDRSCDAHGNNRYLTGPHAGHCYPATNAYVKEADTSHGFASIYARRDARFKLLQELRRSEIFAVVRGRIFGL